MTSGRDCSRRSSRGPGSRSRSQGCASSCAASLTRSRPPARGSCPPATRSACGPQCDLHDGAQQRLVSIGLALRHAQHELGHSAGEGRRVDRRRGHRDRRRDRGAAGARTGSPPAQLDAGLTPGLRELAARAPLPVQVRANGERFPQEVEAAAYFIASEGLTNAVKHSEASQVNLSAERLNGTLTVSISDDGVGGASPNDGSGLRGLADRAAAHGGSLRIESQPDRGTVLTVELPCEW